MHERADTGLEVNDGQGDALAGLKLSDERFYGEFMRWRLHSIQLVRSDPREKASCDENRECDMRWKQIEEEPKTFVLIFETRDEIAAVLKLFAKEQGLAGSSFKAIGALSFTRLGWFNWETKKYELASILEEQVELLSLIGDIALKDGQPQVHLVVGRRDGTAHGGHLLEAHVRPTCELILIESPAHLHKKFDPESGLALIQLWPSLTTCGKKTIRYVNI
jgi:predicted DNA-binding protein with PD1-like motif